MHNFVLKPSARFFTGAMLLLILVSSACQQQPANGNSTTTNTSTTNSSTTNTSNANMGTNTTTGTSIDTREPEQYSATITLKLEVTGNQNMSTPPLTANFARNGADRRVSFKIPGSGDEVVYLDRANKRYVILPNRKQYAELNAQSTGFEIPTVMTPAQIVNQVKSVSGCEQAGEEAFNGRNATKYRCAGAAKTGTQAGEVKTESFIYVDKETGLPLHSESVVSSSGAVAGASTVKIVTEVSNIQTNVVPTTFDEPTGMSKVDPAQVRSQVEAVLKAAMIFAQSMIQSSSAPPPPPPAAATPSASQSPTH
ncbi:MAG TPA: hypothetical protein VF766_02470 [Pyrinomonadaceae bacterium]